MIFIRRAPARLRDPARRPTDAREGGREEREGAEEGESGAPGDGGGGNVVRSDRGAHFVAECVKALAKSLGTEWTYGSIIPEVKRR